MGLSIRVLVRTPQTGGSARGLGLALGAVEAFRASWKLTVSVTHSPSLRTLLWKAMLAASWHQGAQKLKKGRWPEERDEERW